MPKYQRLSLAGLSLFVVGVVYFGAFSSLDLYAPLKAYLATGPLQIGAMAYLLMTWRKTTKKRSKS
ncbi:MAG: hypothetical protein IGR80_01425 [Synechococcales cyanobacterium K44_A2020_017]|nr:hypothetical protein [Synechococcales cyanobacterium K32_A2020_035]MBF2093403.1 hypothetical protein [Synechococcales cyanobacterium K44_A2020_017]